MRADLEVLLLLLPPHASQQDTAWTPCLVAAIVCLLACMEWAGWWHARQARQAQDQRTTNDRWAERKS